MRTTRPPASITSTAGRSPDSAMRSSLPRAGAPLDDTSDHLEREVAASEERLRRAERLPRLLQRAVDAGNGRVRVVWHGYPTEAEMEELAAGASRTN